MNFKNLLFIGLFASVLLQSCGEDVVEPVVEADYKAELTNLTDNVIIATYQDLADKAVVMFNEVKKLQAGPNAITLNNARQAWRDCRAPWESSEGFLFGPVDTDGVDPAIDSWPVNIADLDGVLASTDELTEAYISASGDGVKGFHTIEYLLWGSDGSKEILSFTAREFEYIVATVENLKNETAGLANSWKSGYGNSLKTAGASGNSLFVSQKSALEQLADAVVGICDEVFATKIASPFGDPTPKPIEEESRFSHNSKNDFANNIRSISNIYYGNYNVGNGGLSTIISKKDPVLDTQIKDAILNAISSIENITGNFSDAIYHNRSDVETAKNAVESLHDLLKDEMQPVISNL